MSASSGFDLLYDILFESLRFHFTQGFGLMDAHFENERNTSITTNQGMLLFLIIKGEVLLNKKFRMIDEPFVCKECGQSVSKLNYTARNHCPRCLYSLHVDNNPGDRACACKGLLEPIGVQVKSRKYVIVYKCVKCGMVKKNVAANDDNIQLIIELTANPLPSEI